MDKNTRNFSESLGFEMQSKLFMWDWPWKVGIHLNLKEAILGIYKLKEFEPLERLLILTRKSKSKRHIVERLKSDI